MNEAEKAASGNSPQSEQRTTRERSSLCKVLPTDRIAFDRQIEILRAYAACFESNGGQPVSNAQAGETLKPSFSASTLGVAVPFFTDILLITRKAGDSFVPSPELLAYNQAFTLSPAEAKRKIRPLFENTWFCRLLTPRLRLSPQTEKECMGLLAIESKAEEVHMERIQQLIKFLEFAGIAAINGGTISFVPLIGDLTDAPQKPANGSALVDSQEEIGEQEAGYHTYVLPLQQGRKITIKAPLDLTRPEITRLKMWAEVTLLLDWTGNEKEQENK